MNLALIAFTSLAIPQAPAYDSELEVALGLAGLTSRSARFDSNLLRMFRQGEFTTTLYDACHENPWRIPIFAQAIKQELALTSAKPHETLTTAYRQLGWHLRRSLLGDPIAGQAAASKKAQALHSVLADWKARGWITGELPPIAKLPAEVQSAAALILLSVPRALEMRRLAFQGLADLSGTYARLTSGPAADQESAFNSWLRSAGDRVDAAYLGSGSYDLAAACQEAATRLAVVDPDEAYSWRIATKFGSIILSGGKSSTYDETALLIIDTGKDDTYVNLPCNRSETNALSLVLDSDGNDKYVSDTELATKSLVDWSLRASAQTKPGPGSATLGVSILMDMQGKDLYRSHRYGIGSSQFGVALCCDFGGDDLYDSYQNSQGFATFGVAVLEDRAGNDEYSGFHQVQACGQTAGIAFLIDREGNDKYVANDSLIVVPSAQSAQHNVSMSQGAGNGLRADFLDSHSLAGGVGVLFDLGGNDTYSCGVFGQGVGYWEGVGMLLDDSGDDSYLGQWYAQGASAHFAIGYLEDSSGKDSYVAPMNMAQGAGHDFSFGGLFDRLGDDTYAAPNLSLGAGNANGVGWFVDGSGNDTYESSGLSLGSAAEAPKSSLRVRALCLGVFLDLGGDDKFPGASPWAKNGSRSAQWKDKGATPGESQVGVFLDR